MLLRQEVLIGAYQLPLLNNQQQRFPSLTFPYFQAKETERNEIQHFTF